MLVETSSGSDRRVRSMRRPMRRAYAGNYLDRGMKPPVELPTNIDVAGFLRESALADLGGEPVTVSTPDGDERIARMMAAETVAAINRSKGKNSANWYTDAIDGALRVAALMHPELASDEAAVALDRGFKDARDARCIFFACMAITSQNNKVPETVRYALEQYRHYVDTGRVLPRVYGQKGASVAGNLRRLNDMLDQFEGDVSALRSFLDTPFTMREIREEAAKLGIRLGGGELIDEPVTGSILFGPKIGNGFYQNLVGNHSTKHLTFDLWWMRTWGRYTGNLVKGQVSIEQVERLAYGLAVAPGATRDEMVGQGIDPDAAFMEMAPDELVATCRPLVPLWEGMRRGMVARGMTNPEISQAKAEMGWPGAADRILHGLARSIDQPERAADRRWMRSVVSRALDILRTRGYRMTAADMQATLWYPERSLYAALRGRKVDWANVSYDEALADAARKEGIPDDEVEWARRNGPHDHPGGGAELVIDGTGGGGDPEAPARGFG